MKNTFEAEYKKRRKEYDENENFRVALEKEFNENPKHIKYSIGFYRFGEGVPGSEDFILFPIKIIDGRKIFGKLQCKITPYLKYNEKISGHELGTKWVDRKFLILSHDHEYNIYNNLIE